MVIASAKSYSRRRAQVEQKSAAAALAFHNDAEERRMQEELASTRDINDAFRQEVTLRDTSCEPLTLCVLRWAATTVTLRDTAMVALAW